jgi:pilus assembly protein Flp/PilA
MDRLLRLLRDEEGATAVEYAVMLALIVGVCFGALISLGNATADSFTSSQEAITGAMGN